AEHAVRPAARLVQLVDQGALMVGVHRAHSMPELPRPRDDHLLQLGERRLSVDLRLPLAEQVQVRAVEEEDVHPARVYARAAASARAQSSALASRSTGAPMRSRRTNRTAPRRAFLSRPIASRAACRCPESKVRPSAMRSRSRSRSQRCSRSPPSSSAHLTTSASPLHRSREGSVVSSTGSQTTRRGWWNAPTRFLPARRLAPVFPPSPASTWASRVEGTLTQGTPRR